MADHKKGNLMALTLCPECQGKVSDQASACPHCGFPVKSKIADKPVAKPSLIESNSYSGEQNKPHQDFRPPVAKPLQSSEMNLATKPRENVLAISFYLVLVGICCFIVIMYFVTHANPVSKRNEISESVIDSRVARNEAQIVIFNRLMEEKKYWDARNFAIKNIDVSDKKNTLIADAEIKAYLQTINDPKASRDKRNKALTSLASDYPDHAKPYAEAAKRAELEILNSSQVQGQTVVNKYAAKARKEGVSLGMVPEEVLMSSWGQPNGKSRSTSTFGGVESWYYSSGSSLIFTDGRLTQINN